jgi:hypothetical protein
MSYQGQSQISSMRRSKRYRNDMITRGAIEGKIVSLTHNARSNCNACISLLSVIVTHNQTQVHINNGACRGDQSKHDPRGIVLPEPRKRVRRWACTDVGWCCSRNTCVRNFLVIRRAERNCPVDGASCERTLASRWRPYINPIDLDRSVHKIGRGISSSTHYTSSAKKVQGTGCYCGSVGSESEHMCVANVGADLWRSIWLDGHNDAAYRRFFMGDSTIRTTFVSVFWNRFPDYVSKLRVSYNKKACIMLYPSIILVYYGLY